MPISQTILDDFAAWLPDDLRESLADDLKRFQAATGTDDLDLFAHYLHQQGLIDAPALEHALARPRGCEVTSVETLRFRLHGDNAQRTFARTSPEGRHALLMVAGQGSMGEVWLGKDHDLRRVVAFKTLTARYRDDPGVVRRFVQEAQLTAQLEHPNIVPIYGLEVARDGALGYAMKRVEGRTLADVMAEAADAWRTRGREDRSHDLRTRLELWLRVCDALAYAHSRGVIHRDLKPENVMVGPFGEVYVMDWGVARLVGGHAAEEGATRANDAARTQLGDAVGTPTYMSPEQARGLNDQLGPASDQYGLGVMLQQLVTLQPAVIADDAVDALRKVAKATREPMRPLVRRQPIPAALTAIVARACAKQPEKRYPSVVEMAEDVRRYLRDEPPSVLPEGLFRRISRRLGPYREALVILGLALLLSTAGLLGSTLVLIQGRTIETSVRDERTADLLAKVARRGHTIDAELLGVERLLEGLAASASMALTDTAPDASAPRYSVEQLDAGNGPPDLAQSTRYGRAVSYDFPVFKLAPDTDASDVRDEIGQLTRLNGMARRLIFRSLAQDAIDASSVRLRKLVDDKGAPLTWIYVGTPAGVHWGYPGHGGLPDGFDPRKRPWYTTAENARGATWGAPYLDVNGMGLMLPCSMALRGRDGKLLGVAGVDVDVRWIIDRLLVAPGVVADEFYLLDREARVVLRSGQESLADANTSRNRALRLPSFPITAVADAVRDRRTGVLHVTNEAGVPKLAVIIPLQTLGWSYVVVGDDRAILRTAAP